MAEGETRSFLIQFLAETGDAVTAMNWLGRSMQKFPSLAVSAAAETEVAMAEMDLALQRAGESAWALSDAYTAMGRDSTEMLRAAGAAAKIGIAGETNLLRYTAAARDFGFITKTSADQAASSLSDLSIALGYETPEQVERLASGMVVLSRKTNVTAAELGRLMQQVGPLSKAIGVSESTVMALSASMAQTGLSAGKTIGPISNLMQMMQYSQLSGHALGQTMGLTGKAFEEFAAATPDKQVEMFMQQLGKMDKIPAEATLQGLGIASGLTATKMWEAAKKSQNLTTYIGWASEAMAENTALASESAKVQKTLTFQLSEMGKQLKAVYQMAGKMLAPVLSVLVQSLRGLLFIVMAIPRPILAVAAAVSFLIGGMMTLAWLSSSKLVAGIIKTVLALKTEMAAVGGLTGLYKSLTNAKMANVALERARGLGQAVSPGMFGRGASLAKVGGLAGLGKAGLGAGAAGQVAATSGMMGMASAAAAALGVSVAALLGIVLAVIAALVILGLMIYKGVKLMQEGSDKAKLLGATLLLLTGPIGATVLGFMMLAKPLKKFKDEAVKALMPVYELFQKLKPILYVIGLLAATVFAPILIPFGILYVMLPFIVGLLEGFADVMLWAFEPFVPFAEMLGDLFDWIAEKLGGLSGEGGGWQDTLKSIGRVIGWLVFGPGVLLLKLFTLIGELIIWIGENIYEIGAVIAWPFKKMNEITAAVFQAIGDNWELLVGLITNPIMTIYNLWNVAMMKIGWAMRWIGGPLKEVAGYFWDIAKSVLGVTGALFGSSPWHVKESMEGEVIPALQDTSKGFEGVADSAMGVHQVARAKGGVVPRPRGPSLAELEASKAGAAAPVGAGMGAGMAAAAPEGPKEILVRIPVTLTLDGAVIGKTIVEQLIDLRERYMNPPGFPMRGVEPAF